MPMPEAAPVTTTRPPASSTAANTSAAVDSGVNGGPVRWLVAADTRRPGSAPCSRGAGG
jgi:hypothetical protein